MRGMAEPYALPWDLMERGRDVVRVVREGGEITLDERTHLVFAILLRQACGRGDDETAMGLTTAWTELQRAGPPETGMEDVGFEALLDRIGAGMHPAEPAGWILAHPGVLTPAFDAELADASVLRERRSLNRPRRRRDRLPGRRSSRGRRARSSAGAGRARRRVRAVPGVPVGCLPDPGTAGSAQFVFLTGGGVHAEGEPSAAGLDH